MKPVTVSILKKELKDHTQEELIEICLKLAKFKKENKELLTYFLFDSNDEDEYVRTIKKEIDIEFLKLNSDSLYYAKKGIRKILRILKKYIRYSKNKETEATILLHFCFKLKLLKSSFQQSKQIINIYEKQLMMAQKAINVLHEDLQYDLNLKVEQLEGKL